MGAVAGVDESAAGSAGFVQASTADAAATRATIAPAMATVIGFLLKAILGCPSHGFMTRQCYTTRVQGYGGCQCATAAVEIAPTVARKTAVNHDRVVNRQERLIRFPARPERSELPLGR